MATLYDINPNALIEAVSKELEKTLEQPPEWTQFVKTGPGKERVPSQENWWYLRAAAILRTVDIKGPIGVAKLRVKFGNKHRRGHKPARFRKASGNILRKLLQQLEKAGYVQNVQKGVHKGRKITPQGKSLLDKAVKLK